MTATSVDLQAAKVVVRDLHDALDRAADGEVEAVLAKYLAPDVFWRGLHPFGEQHTPADVAAAYWLPLRHSFTSLQRRPDVFLAGESVTETGEGGHPEAPGVWVCEMGHLMGLFDRPWLGIPPTGRMVFHRYAEFSRVLGDVVAEQAMFVDVIAVMQQAGQDPLPPQTGAAFVHPGPRTHDGLLHEPQDPSAGETTMQVVEEMVDALHELNVEANWTGEDWCPPETLARTWHDDMIWYGPAGIGATYTIDRYQQQHQLPFRANLAEKTFNGHVARFAEGDYACFFGWPNLTNRSRGGFLGITASNTPADMRVVDVYRREGHKLAENWVFIDILHYLNMQGLDVLGRLRELNTIPERDA